MKNLIKRIPIFRSIAGFVYFVLIAPLKSFPGSEEYWKKRYRSGGTSGIGSYQKFAEFKAEVLNNFVRVNQIGTIIEYGCGDGNQLSLSEYPSYIGFDVSPEVLSQCQNLFSNDKSKIFKLIGAYVNETAQLTLSLDVIYHLVEDETFSIYMNRLFESSSRFVIIYSSNTDKQAWLQAAHVKHRNFTAWVVNNKPEWELINHISNRYSHNSITKEGTAADFYIFEKSQKIDIS